MATIAQKLQAILDSKSDIKDAIEAKGVTVGDAPFDQYASKIEAIPTPIEEAPESDVCFYDYDGKRIASFTIAEAKALTQAEYNAILPPAHEGLTFQEWNWSLADIQGYNRRYIDVGANYAPTDGKIHFLIHAEAGETFSVYAQSDYAWVIDYGDGNTEEKASSFALATHSYMIAGDYDVTIDKKVSTSTGVWRLRELADANKNAIPMIKEVWCNADLRPASYAFRYYQCRITFAKDSFTSLTNTFTNSFIPQITIPKSFESTSGTVVFSQLVGKVCMPKSVNEITQASTFSGYYNTRLVFPECSTVGSIPSSMTQNSWAIEVLSIPSSYNPVSLSGMNRLRILDIVQGWTPTANITNFLASMMWTTDSIVDFFTKLGTTQTAITLTFGSTNLAKLTAEEKALATNKGYTLA